MKKLYFLLLLFCIVKESIAQTTYTFTGNGNWTVAFNWNNNVIPPSVLPLGDIIIINSAPGDSCVLNTPQTILTGASLIIASGANFIVREGLVNHKPILPDSTFTDSRDGQVYPYKTIGTQVWMTKNLNFNASGSSCYDDSAANCAIYGRLYDWNTALTVAPPGWHLPGDEEWTTLTTFLGGLGVAGGKMKSTTGWNAPNTGATNSSGFAGLPGGRRNIYGTFNFIGNYGFWFSSTAGGAYSAWSYYLNYSIALANRNDNNDLTNGFSVRCVRN